jgi:uroporphyrinogen-III decarboxylase
VHETLGYVFDAIKLTKVDDEVPLIGFAGSPGQCNMYWWKDKDLKVLINKGFCFSHPTFVQKIPIRLFYIYKRKKQELMQFRF